MVQWKGDIQKDEAGEKAANLESLESFEVPNFFVLTRSEVGKFINSEEPEEIANQKLPESVVERVKNAYQDIGMSSEVRNASGQAKNLVGNQRESQRVSVRISSNENLSDYQLNVGASGLEEAIRRVIASYYRENSGTPALIFQKMIEPEFTGAVINNYTRRNELVEIVEGLGHSLEEGLTVPEFYLLKNSSVQQRRVPDKQVKISRNPMSGQRRTRTVSNGSPTFQNSEIEDLARKTSRENLSIKFVYKRGSFYAVDAFKSEPMNLNPDLDALKVSEGEIEGREGKDYIISEEAERTEKPLVAKKGGYTTTESQRKRRQGIPAVVSLRDRDKISEEEEAEKGAAEKQGRPSSSVFGVSATGVRPISDFPGLSDNPFSFQGQEQNFARGCEEALAQNAKLIDGRNINREALIRCLEAVEQVKVLALKETDQDLLRKIVEKGVEVVAVPDARAEEFSQELLRQEKKFILDNLRN